MAKARFRLGKKGQALLMGELESLVMEIIWDQGPQTVREVFDRLSRSRDLAYTTVMTVMSRLATKKVLNKRKQGNAFLYKATLSKDDFERETARDIFSSLLQGYGGALVQPLAESIDLLEDKDLDELMRLVESKREQRR